ncbi:N-acetylmuramoyl-L-alanine amidase [Streptomyces sp. NBC_00247]|uniref:N-acetylmuramoyl-L-alanine amidase n=1 Tax=Streptomyces sp. NBC_00247 TaxID=2975689 RepID=UPI003FA7BD96
MQYTSVPPTPPAARPAARRPVRAAGLTALAVLCLPALAGCGGTEVKAQPRAGAPATAAPSAAPEPAASAPAADGSAKPSRKGPLTGRTVVIDPGHNPHNHEHTREIARQVDIGTGHKECDTTGTSTDAGYAEARFTLDVAHRMRDLLEAEGAKVVLTYDDDRPYGPCVDERARIGNAAKADAVVSVHADGSAVGNRGFHVILPALVRDGAADTSRIVAPSRDLGTRIAGRFAAATGSAPSNYIGGGTGLDVRDDLGGLNMSTVAKVFIECGNMRDPKDAALLTSASWRRRAAEGISDGIALYLKG